MDLKLFYGSEGYVLKAGNLLISNIERLSEVQLETFLEENTYENSLKGESGAEVYIFSEASPSRLMEWEAALKSVPMLPIEMMKIYARNIAHDLKGNLNAISSMLTMTEMQKDMRDGIESNLSEAREGLENNLALAGLHKHVESSSSVFEKIIRQAVKRYPDVEFDLSFKLPVRDIKLPLAAINASVDVAMRQLFSNLYQKRVLIEASCEKGVLSLSFSTDSWQENIAELLFLQNKGPFHGLGFLRLAAEEVRLIINERPMLLLRWRLDE